MIGEKVKKARNNIIGAYKQVEENERIIYSIPYSLILYHSLKLKS